MRRSVIDMSEVGIRDRTKEAFQELVIAELPALYALARRLVRDGAEDLVQEALLQAFRAFGTLKEEAAALVTGPAVGTDVNGNNANDAA